MAGWTPCGGSVWWEIGTAEDNIIGPSFYFVYVTNTQYVHVTKIERDDLK